MSSTHEAINLSQATHLQTKQYYLLDSSLPLNRPSNLPVPLLLLQILAFFTHLGLNSLTRAPFPSLSLSLPAKPSPSPPTATHRPFRPIPRILPVEFFPFWV